MLSVLRDLWQQFRGWLSKRWPLVLLIAVVALIQLGSTWLDRIEHPPFPNIAWTLASSTQHADVLWIKQAAFYSVTTANDNGVTFMIPIAGDSIMAIDVKTGATIWDVGLPFEQRGIRSMVANQNTVFAVTALDVDAYDAKTGKLDWSTTLGEGHVTIFFQLDSDVLRVYYGKTLYELDPETGKILTTQPIPEDATIWVSGNVLLRIVPYISVIGFDRQGGKTLWVQNGYFMLDEGFEPQILGTNTQFVYRGPGSSRIKGICALNLQSGNYNWCRPEEFSSTLAVDHQSQLGYAMRSDDVLLTIDLPTGAILGETRFLASGPIDPQIGDVSSITVSQGVVVIAFADGNQTFGVRILP